MKWLALVAVDEDKTPTDSYFKGLLERHQEEKLHFSFSGRKECTNDLNLAQDKLLLEVTIILKNYPLHSSADTGELVTAFYTVAVKYSNGETVTALNTAESCKLSEKFKPAEQVTV